MHVASVAGTAAQGSSGFFHLVHVRYFLDVVFLHILGHRVHDPGHVLFRFRIIVEFEPGTAVRADVVGIGRMAMIAMRAERACPAFHDVVNLVPRQILGKNLQILRRREIARWASASGWRALRCLGHGRDRENRAGNQRDRDCGRGQGSDFQADSSHREIGCCQMDGILLNKDAPAKKSFTGKSACRI